MAETIVHYLQCCQVPGGQMPPTHWRWEEEPSRWRRGSWWESACRLLALFHALSETHLYWTWWNLFAQSDPLCSHSKVVLLRLSPPLILKFFLKVLSKNVYSTYWYVLQANEVTQSSLFGGPACWWIFLEALASAVPFLEVNWPWNFLVISCLHHISCLIHTLGCLHRREGDAVSIPVAAWYIIRKVGIVVGIACQNSPLHIEFTQLSDNAWVTNHHHSPNSGK